MENWSNIFNIASLPSTNLVYIAVGSSMGYSHYDEVNNQKPESNNQQYPCFLDKFRDNKLIILIDPALEAPLKLESFFATKGDPLGQVDSVTGPDDKYISRTFRNSTTHVFAFNTYFYYETRKYFHNDEEKQINAIVDHCVANLINLISICLSKVDKTKLIFQDYSGPDTFNFYSSLLACFDRDELLDNVMFDVTQKDSGCFIEITPELAAVDSSNRFIQDKFYKLVKLASTSTEKYSQHLNERIGILQYPLSLVIGKLNESIDFDLSSVFGLNRVKNLATIYNFKYDEHSKDPRYILETYTQLFCIIIQDIIESKQCCTTQCDYLMSIINQRDKIYNALSMLRYE